MTSGRAPRCATNLVIYVSDLSYKKVEAEEEVWVHREYFPLADIAQFGHFRTRNMTAEKMEAGEEAGAHREYFLLADIAQFGHFRTRCCEGDDLWVKAPNNAPRLMSSPQVAMLTKQFPKRDQSKLLRLSKQICEKHHSERHKERFWSGLFGRVMAVLH
ncbi:hypothetical protein B0H10DRAFT_1960244 [Mycena sp. CBHHK59/15]|nr:hypothetical protein B0H10DRAFT_1960244 [Mycena sp. CBHHK59/15]